MMETSETARRWKIGDLVRKKTKSQWRGRVAGFYSTAATPEGYCVESLFEVGSVQVWPLEALEDWDGELPTNILQPIETAPRDGTFIDLYLKDGSRYTSCFWSNRLNSWADLDNYGRQLKIIDIIKYWAAIPTVME